MFLSILFQAFLFSSVNTQPAVDFGLQGAQHVAAASAEMEYVEGYNEYTALTFAHSLPQVNSGGFGPQRIESESLGILTTADSAFVMDRRTSKVLFDKSSDDIRSIASITKLMTALTLLDQEISFDDILTISSADYREGGIIHFYTGEQFLLQDLWMSGLIASDNVAIAALVRSTGMSEEEFAEKMNQKAAALGMENSSFSEPTGISRYNRSTARDIALLLDTALSEPTLADAIRRPSYSFAPLNKETVRTVKNTNKLLTSYLNEEPYEVLGGKTGFTFEAGYCLGVAVSGEFDSDDLIVVVLGADSVDSRFQEVKGLIDWTYSNYRW